MHYNEQKEKANCRVCFIGVSYPYSLGRGYNLRVSQLCWQRQLAWLYPRKHTLITNKNACITAKSLDYSKVPALESRTSHYNSSPFLAKNAGNSLPKARLSALHQPPEHVVSLRDQFWDPCYL